MLLEGDGFAIDDVKAFFEQHYQHVYYVFYEMFIYVDQERRVRGKAPMPLHCFFLSFQATQFVEMIHLSHFYILLVAECSAEIEQMKGTFVACLLLSLY